MSCKLITDKVYLCTDMRTEEQDDRRTVGKEDRRTGGEEDRRTGGHWDRRTVFSWRSATFCQVPHLPNCNLYMSVYEYTAPTALVSWLMINCLTKAYLLYWVNNYLTYLVLENSLVCMLTQKSAFFIKGNCTISLKVKD